MFLSIVIPVYNAEKYIRACVDSLRGLPTYLSISDAEMEVILVDDGSKDESGRVCDELSQHGYSFNVKVLHQDNQGVSVARNEGLRIATGEWIWFIDADDFVKCPQCRCNNIQDVNNANFVVTGFVWSENGKSDSFGANIGEVPYNLWRCWFRKSIIEEYGIRFVVGRKYAEDQEFLLNYLLYGEKKYAVPQKSFAISDSLYHYEVRPGSAMTKKGMKYKKIKDIALVNILFMLKSIQLGSLFHGWVMREIKRMTKVLMVILQR